LINVFNTKAIKYLSKKSENGIALDYCDFFGGLYETNGKQSKSLKIVEICRKIYRNINESEEVE